MTIKYLFDLYIIIIRDIDGAQIFDIFDVLHFVFSLTIESSPRVLRKSSARESDSEPVKQGSGDRNKTLSEDFDDQSTWSDHSALEEENDNNDTSVFHTSEGECNDDTIQEMSPSPCSSSESSFVHAEDTPPKRIVSKRKDRSTMDTQVCC